jgi:hypothetical protein
MPHDKLTAIASFILALFLVFLPGVQAKPPEKSGPVIRPLHQKRENVGCHLVLRNATWEAYPIFLDSFIDGLEGENAILMNLDGKEVRLTRQTDFFEDRPVEYTAGEYHISVRFGKFIATEAGGTYKHATVTVSRHGRTTTLKAKGSCGC